MIEHFSTLSLKPDTRLKFWNDVCDNTLPGTCLDSPCEGFRASMRRWHWPSVNGQTGSFVLIRPHSDASRVWRKAMPDRAGSENLVLHFLHRGSARFVHKHYDVPLVDGQFILTPERLGYNFTFSQGHELLVAEIALAPLLARVRDLPALLCTGIQHSPASRLFQEFMLSLWRHSETTVSPAWQADARHSFYDLLAMALNHREIAVPEHAGHPRRSERLLAAAQAFVDNHLDQSDLSSTHIAHALGVSVRTVHRSPVRRHSTSRTAA